MSRRSAKQEKRSWSACSENWEAEGASEDSGRPAETERAHLPPHCRRKEPRGERISKVFAPLDFRPPFACFLHFKEGQFAHGVARHLDRVRLGLLDCLRFDTVHYQVRNRSRYWAFAPFIHGKEECARACSSNRGAAYSEIASSGTLFGIETR